jgi:hypothetical protein
LLVLPLVQAVAIPPASTWMACLLLASLAFALGRAQVRASQVQEAAAAPD